MCDPSFMYNVPTHHSVVSKTLYVDWSAGILIGWHGKKLDNSWRLMSTAHSGKTVGKLQKNWKTFLPTVLPLPTWLLHCPTKLEKTVGIGGIGEFSNKNWIV